MKIENNTNWDTDQFRAFIQAVAKNEELTPEEIGQLKVIIGYRRRSAVRHDEFALCRGRYNQWQIKILCVKGVGLYKPYLARAIAFVLNYNRGVRPRTIRLTPRFYGNVAEEWQWANNLPLTMKQEQPQPQKQPVENKQYVVVKKMQHCLRQIVLWEKKAKLAKTKLSRWHARLRYYERNLAKCAPASCASDSSGLLENSGNVVAEERKVQNE